ncbi:glycosidase [Vibrio navarrensis]|uniref:alpha-amylase family glycosyl hydrolase n=1 Tax=Vibrio navarrensis TaxID=29495 RepID=UPI001868144F|nr:alpha-amylase family glycosyl hydrolase [Vibrio navarrensis]MBE3657297.1 glycosidase [Vibrio navarrensis]
MKQVLTTLSLAVATALLAGCNSSSNVEKLPSTNAYQCDVAATDKADDLRIYQVMVESFVNGNEQIGHGTGYGTSHHMGDIQGIIDSLDYIQSLGMNGIWLTPIFNSVPKAGQDHWADRLDATGYFATNYFEIDPRFGTMDDARRLVEEAHARGLYVFFDGVFGHHKGNVVASPTGKLPAGGNNPVDYPESLAFYQEVAQFWVKELKIDGWRLDQAYQVPTEAWVEIRKAVDDASKSVTYTNSKGENVNPLGYMVAEIWAGENRITETGYGSAENPALCSAFDFPVRYRLVETFAVNEAGVGGKSGEWLAEGMDLHALYPSHAQPNLMIGNHDLVRFGDLLQRGNIAEPQDAEYWLRHKAVFAFQAAYTGPITLYYGDEIGDQVDNFAAKVEQDCAVKGLCDDHVARSSGKVEGVTATLNANEQDLKQYVQKLMTLRSNHPALAKGKRVNVLADNKVYADHKSTADESILYVANLGKGLQYLQLSDEKVGSTGSLTDLLTGEEIKLIDGQYLVSLNPFEARFLKINQPSAVGPKVAKAAMASGIGEGFMAQCDNPTLDESGPIRKKLYVVGDFSDSAWQHQDHRQFEYKGDGVYQVVTNEKPGSYRMQYAAKTWTPQFTAKGLSLKLGQDNPLIKGGYGKDTAVTIMAEGRYVWSLQFDQQGTPLKVMASKCAE